MVEIEFHPATESMFDTECDVLVCPVNCVGVMGRGLAAEFRSRWPKLLTSYRLALDSKQLAPGKVVCVEVPDEVGSSDKIVLFPTKMDWRANSNIKMIEDGLVDLVKLIKTMGIESIAIPALGCGLGRLNWGSVKPKIVRAFDDFQGSLRVEIFEPQGE